SSANTNQIQTGVQLIFSSEITPIIESGLIPKKPNDRIIYRYLKYRVHDDNKETFFEGVYRLMPGELLRVNPSPSLRAGNKEVRVESFSNLKEELLTNSHPEFSSGSNSGFRNKFGMRSDVVNEFKNKLSEA